MGRSQLQGTPWHYEYNKGNGINNSKNCAFNTGNRCACKISPNHNSQCVGKSNCDEFERGNGRAPIKKNDNQKHYKQKSVSSKAIKEPSNKPYKTQNKKKSSCVEIDSVVTIKSQTTNEVIELGKITSKDNPFYAKEINSVVSVKGIPYKIVKIITKGKTP